VVGLGTAAPGDLDLGAAGDLEEGDNIYTNFTNKDEFSRIENDMNLLARIFTNENEFSRILADQSQIPS